MRNTNPFNLKVLTENLKDYLNTDEFLFFLKNNKIVVRKDNLPRFANFHNIKMAKGIRKGSGGTAPTIFKIPKREKLEEIKYTMYLNNNNVLGKENVKKKENKILEIFDKAESKKESKSSIADKVTKSLKLPCNRKLVRRVLNEKRSSRLSKLL